MMVFLTMVWSFSFIAVISAINDIQGELDKQVNDIVKSLDDVRILIFCHIYIQLSLTENLQPFKAPISILFYKALKLLKILTVGFNHLFQAITTQEAKWKDYSKYVDKSHEDFKYENYRYYFL